MSIEIQIGANIGGVDKAVAKVGNSLEGIQSVAQQTNTNLNNLSGGITNVESSLQGVQSVASETSASLKTLSTGVSNSAKNLKDVNPVAQKAQNTLTGLSGVVRDLPFGFVAIQNNLPILADQFGALSEKSGGTNGALKALGASLAGPAGVSFAIGAVISGITVLVQKYGSLSAAITEVLNLSKSQRDLNLALDTATAKNVGSAESEITVMKTLTGILTDANQSLSARNGAYDELNKQYPGLLTNLDQEKLKTGQLNTELAARLLLFTKQIQLNGQRAALEKLIGEEAEKSFKSISQFKNQDFFDGLIGEIGSLLKGFNAGTAGLQDLSKGLSNSAKSTAFYETRLKTIQTELSNVDGQILAIVEAGKKQKKSEEEAAKAIEEAKRESLARTEALKKEREAILKRIEADRQARSIRVPFEVSVTIADIGKQDFGKLYKEKIINKFKEAQKASGGIQIPANLPTIDTSKILQSLIDVQNATKERRAAILKEANLQAAADLFKSTFFDPVQNLFTDLLNGADGAFKAFTKAVLQAINQIVAKIIATGIISLLANLISGGTAGLGKAVIGDILGVIGIKKERIGNPNFGGIGAGGMQMSGAVNVVLRGQDLVGALNRTNAQINRVG